MKKIYEGDYYVYIHTINKVVFYIGSSKIFYRDKAGFNVHHHRAFSRKGRSLEWKLIAGNKKVETHIILYRKTLEEIREKELELIEMYSKMGFNIANKYVGTRVYKISVFGKVLNSYPNFHAASIDNNIDPSSICKCANNYTNRKTVGGHYYSYSPSVPDQIKNKMYPVQFTEGEGDIRAHINLLEAAKYFNSNTASAISGAIKNPKYSAYGYKWKFESYDYCIEHNLFKI